jgi:hexosaminidase
MTDAQSTPFDSKTFPALKQGAFSPTLYYTPADVSTVVEYARVRGVQVLVEIDMPGHNYAVGIGYPELICNCSAMYPLETQFWTSSFALYKGELVYEWIEKLLTEMASLLPSKLFHIGGDEVQYQCWESDPKMVAYLASRNITRQALYMEFEARVFKILLKLGKSPMFWNSVYDSGVALPKDAVVHSYQVYPPPSSSSSSSSSSFSSSPPPPSSHALLPPLMPSSLLSHTRGVMLPLPRSLRRVTVWSAPVSKAITWLDSRRGPRYSLRS